MNDATSTHRPPQVVPGKLTSLDAARQNLLGGMTTVPEELLSIDEAIGWICAGVPPVETPLPLRSIALRDGWAAHANGLAGASTYAPAMLTQHPARVEVGDELPEGCDCVVDLASIETFGDHAQASVESFPGENIRRAGEDLAPNGALSLAGRRLTSLDAVLLREIGATQVAVRRPRLLLVDVPARDHVGTTAGLVASMACDAGARVTHRMSASRNADDIVAALDADGFDLMLLVGGTGSGRTDESVLALHSKDRRTVHGLALQPGRTAAVARIGSCPVVALPGRLDHALTTFWALAEPALDRLSGRIASPMTALPLARKIASGVGMAELVLLSHDDAQFMPLAQGDLPIGRLAQATHWHVVPAGSEGYPPGTRIAARSIHFTA